MDDMTPSLGIVTERRRVRAGGEDGGNRHLLILLLDGKPMCPLAEFRGDDEAAWARKLLGLEVEPAEELSAEERNLARAQGSDLAALIED